MGSLDHTASLGEVQEITNKNSNIHKEKTNSKFDLNEPIEIELSSDDNEERKSQFENDEPKEIIKELIEKEQNHNSSKIPFYRKRDLKKISKQHEEDSSSSDECSRTFLRSKRVNKSKIKQIAKAKLDAILRTKSENDLDQEGIENIKSWIIQSEMKKPETMKFLTKFTAAYCKLASEKPELFTKALCSLSSVFTSNNNEFEELIIYPNKEKEKAVNDYLRKAKNCIKICVFMFSNQEVLEILKDMKLKGVNIQIISDNRSRLKTLPYYAVKHGMEFRHTALNSSSLMHHKFAVIDNKFVINGSFNWTTNAPKKNHESIMITSSKKFVKQFNDEFDRLWKTLPYRILKTI